MLITPNLVKAPAGLTRNHIAPLDQVSAEYDALYDKTTVAYDVFWSEDHTQIVIIAPPLVNFADAITLGPQHLRIDGADTQLVDYHIYPRNCRIFIHPNVLNDAGQLEFHFPNSTMTAVTPRENLATQFAGAKILHTLQKNNPLSWIGDWAHFYHTIHDIDTVVIYDNGSTSYSHKELLRTLEKAFPPGFPGRCIVVDWKAPYGPALPPFVSFFCQPSVFEHGRYALYHQADFVINADIDEYIVRSGPSFSQALDHSGEGVICVGGYWLENIPIDPTQLGETPRVWDFAFCDPTRANSGKWAMRPRDLAGDPHVHASEHWINGRPRDEHPNFSVAHCAPLTTRWLGQWREARAIRQEKNAQHWIDPVYVENMRRAFPEQWARYDISALMGDAFIKQRALRRHDRDIPPLRYAQGIFEALLLDFDWSRRSTYMNHTIVYETTRFSTDHSAFAFDIRYRPDGDGNLSVAMLCRNPEQFQRLTNLLEHLGLSAAQVQHPGRSYLLAVRAYTPHKIRDILVEFARLISYIMSIDPEFSTDTKS